MKLEITGGSGYLGAEILKRAPIDWRIAATFFQNPITDKSVAAFYLAVRDADAVNNLFDQFKPNFLQR